MAHAQPLTKHQEQNVLQGAVAHALLKANVEHEALIAAKQSNVTIMKPTMSANSSEIPMLIPRTDLLGNNVLFLANTLNREASTLQMYDMQKGHKTRIVSKAFYDSTLPISDKALMTEMVQTYCKEFKVTEAVLRARLIKGSQVVKSEDGSISKEAQEAWKNEMKAKFKLAFERAVDQAFDNM